MKIIYIGHACFRIESKGASIVIDPYADGSVPGLSPVREEADMVLCSHSHHDHNAKENVKLSGRTDLPFKITTIETFHDDAQGTKRGPNTIHIIDDGEVTLAHCGDIGCELTEDQLAQLKGVTGLMVPVGGFFTIDPKQAYALDQAVMPKVLFPMHFRTDKVGFDKIAHIDEFTALCKLDKYHGCEFELTNDNEPEAAVMTPRNLITE